MYLHYIIRLFFRLIHSLTPYVRPAAFHYRCNACNARAPHVLFCFLTIIIFMYIFHTSWALWMWQSPLVNRHTHTHTHARPSNSQAVKICTGSRRRRIDVQKYYAFCDRMHGRSISTENTPSINRPTTTTARVLPAVHAYIIILRGTCSMLIHV